jgi:hypothetical protein
MRLRVKEGLLWNRAYGALLVGLAAIAAALPVMAELSLIGPDGVIALTAVAALAVSAAALAPAAPFPERTRLGEALSLLGAGIAAAASLALLAPFALLALLVSGVFVDPVGAARWNVFLTNGLWCAGPLGFAAHLLILRVRPGLLPGALACAAIAGAPLALADWRYWPFPVATFAAGALFSFIVRRVTDDAGERPAEGAAQ